MTRMLQEFREPALENLEKLDRMARRILSEIGIRILSRSYLNLLAEKGVAIKKDRAFFFFGSGGQAAGKSPDPVHPARDIPGT